MSIRDKLALGVVGFVGVIVVVLITRFSTDALGVIVGVALAMAGTIPALAVVAWLAGRQSRYAPPRHDPYYGYPPEAMYYRRLAPPRRPYAPPSRRLPARRGGVAVAPGYTAPRQRETALWLPDGGYAPRYAGDAADEYAIFEPLETDYDDGYGYASDVDMW
ncbi:MAG: hypothetical protein Kow00120_16180 [Anaerolineae bacterium]